MSRLAINEAFLSALGITLPSNCGGKKPLTFYVEEKPGLRVGRGGAEEAGRRRWERPGDLAGGSPPPVRYQSTAESRTHARITAQGLASRSGLLPTSAPAQRLPISPPPRGANRRGSTPLTVRRYSGSGRAGERSREPEPRARGPSWAPGRGWGRGAGRGQGLGQVRGKRAPRPLARTRLPSCGWF